MIARIALLATAALLLLPALGEGRTVLTGPDKKPWMDRCVARSQVATPNLEVMIYRSQEVGRSYIDPVELKIWLAGIAGSGDDCYILRHELGHLFDWTMLTANDRHYISCRIIGHKSPNPWWSYFDGSNWTSGASQVSPLEQFAEAYAIAATVKRPHRNQATGSIAIGYSAWDYFVDSQDHFRYRKIKRLVRYLNSRPGPATTAENGQTQPLPEC